MSLSRVEERCNVDIKFFCLVPEFWINILAYFSIVAVDCYYLIISMEKELFMCRDVGLFVFHLFVCVRARFFFHLQLRLYSLNIASSSGQWCWLQNNIHDHQTNHHIATRTVNLQPIDTRTPYTPGSRKEQSAWLVVKCLHAEPILQIETIHRLHVIDNLCYDFSPFYTFQSPFSPMGKMLVTLSFECRERWPRTRRELAGLFGVLCLPPAFMTTHTFPNTIIKIVLNDTKPISHEHIFHCFAIFVLFFPPFQSPFTIQFLVAVLLIGQCCSPVLYC